MIGITPRNLLGRGFWLLLAMSAGTNIAYSATAPVLPRYVLDVFEGSPPTVGAVVALASVVSLVVQPFAGGLTDRFGFRRTSAISAAIAVAGMALTVVSMTLPATVVGRILFGGGGAAMATAMTAWVIAAVHPAERGRALGLFGLGVWIGLALGPVLGENVYQSAGFVAVWIVCGSIQAATLVAVALVPRPVGVTGAPFAVTATDPVAAVDGPFEPGWRGVLSAVWRPGLVAAAAWGAEGMLISYLVLHLESRGVAPDGVLGAASVFTVFAASVVASRIAFGSLTDRLGPVRMGRVALVTLAAGLGIIAVSGDFWLAAFGALVLGFGFAPLYPALALMVTTSLDPGRRGIGLGVFNSFTSTGMIVGAFVGGIMATSGASGIGFLLAAGAQLTALLVLRRPVRGR